jgi:acyl carrier protein
MRSIPDEKSGDAASIRANGFSLQITLIVKDSILILTFYIKFVMFTHKIMTDTTHFLIDKIEEISFSTVTATDSLWEDRVLDSITIIELVVEIEREFSIQIPFNEIVVEHFETVELIEKFIQSKK